MPRLPVLLAALLTVAAGLGVRALWDGPVAKYAGDALYTVLIFALVVLVWPRIRPAVAAAVAAGLSWAIEFAQLGGIPPVLRPLLGSTFNPPDLFWYAVGAGAAWTAHTWGSSGKGEENAHQGGIQMMHGKTIAFLVAPEGVEEVELTEPWKSVKQAGGTPKLISTSSGQIRAFNHLDKGGTYAVDATVEDVSAADFAGLVLPGGVANPDFLRMDDKAVRFVRDFFDAGKPVAAICHAPWTLVEADVVRGRMVTSWPSLQTDLRNAGAEWVDREVVVCTAGPNMLVTSRKPDDLKAFDQAMIDAFSA